MTSSRFPEIYNTVIDDGHRRLVNKADIISCLCRFSENIELVLESLADYRRSVAEHFRIEETIARASGLDNFQEHERSHEVAMARLDSLHFVAARSDGRAVIERVVSDVMRHELEQDGLFLHALITPEVSGVQEALLPWTDQLDLGVPELDAQHAMLVLRLNRIYEEAMRGDPRGILTELGEEFRVELVRHCGWEENILSRDPLRARLHGENHQILLFDLHNRYFESMSPFQTATLCRDYLRYWVVDHIRHVDAVDFAAAGAADSLETMGLFDPRSLDYVA